ncbi:MAG: DUF1264 domain-containing protein [Chloroflexota bacterium]|nr:MAG: DUF1264 domain-containing protein [Chloroflexota bacterium]
MPMRTTMLFGIVLAVAIGAMSIYLATGGLSTNSKTQTQTQADSPISALTLHLVGVHVIKAVPDRQYVAHHYCQQLESDLIQCAVFDSDQPGAKLMDVEYVVSDEVYRSFSPEEQDYWHPHGYEVDQGLLRAPELPPDKEQEVLSAIRSTRGKTWHMWPTKEDPYPLHGPDLAWSITQDGQLQPEIGKELESAQR